MALFGPFSGAALLNAADRARGPGQAVRVAGGEPFGAHGQRLDVWRPRAPGIRPVVVFFYGGAWAFGRRQEYGFAGRALAEQGFVTVIADYRKLPQASYADFLTDGAAAVRWTLDHAGEIGGDPARLALAGHSAGAWKAVSLALDPRWLAREGIPAGAVRAVAALSGPYDIWPHSNPVIKRAMRGDGDGRLTAPMSHVRADAPPLFLATSHWDRVVPARHALRLAEAIRAAGGQARLANYARLGHVGMVMALARGFRHRAPVLRDRAAFLQEELGQG